MSQTNYEEVKDFQIVIKMINQELHQKGIFDIEYMLINNPIKDVVQIVSSQSEFFNMIKDDRYSNGYAFRDIFESYCQFVKEKYESLYIKDGKNDRNADKNYNKLKEPTQRNGLYLQYPKSDVGMIKDDVEKTLTLMREAIQAYYKVYNNKKLVAELSTKSVDQSDYLEFVINEENLLHLLGVTAGQLRDNPDFIRLTGNRHMNSVEILEWIMNDIQGNNDLMQYSDEFLTRIYSSKFNVSKIQFENDTQTRLLNYHKVGTKSQAFLKYGPFEKVSLVAKLQSGKKLAVNAKSNVAMISQADCFKKYPWAYFGSVQQPNNSYMETLLIDTAAGKKALFKGSTPAIVKGVYRLDSVSSGSTGNTGSGTIGDTDGGNGGNGGNMFSDEEQFDLFCAAYDSFSDTMNFEDLKEYFTGLYLKRLESDSTVSPDGMSLNVSQDLINAILNLNYESAERLYCYIIEQTQFYREESFYDEYTIEVYQQEILDRIQYLTQEQIMDISSKIVGNTFDPTRKKKY